MQNTAWLNFYIYYTDIESLFQFLKKQIISIKDNTGIIEFQIKISFQFGTNLIVSFQDRSNETTNTKEVLYDKIKEYLNLYPSIDNNLFNPEGFRFFPNNSIIVKEDPVCPELGVLLYTTESPIDHYKLFYEYNSSLIKTSDLIVESQQDVFIAALTMNIIFTHKMKTLGILSNNTFNNIFLYFIKNLKENNGLLSDKNLDDLLHIKSENYQKSYLENGEMVIGFSDKIIKCVEENQELDEEWVNIYSSHLNTFFNTNLNLIDNSNLEKDLLVYQFISLNNHKLSICDDQEGLMLFYIQNIFLESVQDKSF